MPENFEISEAVRDWAAKKGFGDLEAHLESFKTKVQAKGYTYVDWDAALRNAILADWAGLRKNQPNQAGQYRQGQPAQAPYNPDDDIPECLREGYKPPPKRVVDPVEQARIKAEQFAAAARYAAMVQEQKDQEAAKHAGTP